MLKYGARNATFNNIPDIFDISLIWKILLEENNPITHFYTKKQSIYLFLLVLNKEFVILHWMR